MNELEKRIENFTKEFNDRNIEVRFDDFLKGIVNFDNVHIEYDKSNGFLKLIGERDNLEFNTLDINYIDYNTEKLEINLDNSQNLKILKK